MAKQCIHKLPILLSIARRLISTASKAGGDTKALYKRLSVLGGDSKEGVEETLNSYLKEGKSVTEKALMRIVRELRKYKSFKTALEITDWMEKKGMEITVSSHAMRLDLISKIRGTRKAEQYFSSLPEEIKDKKIYGALLNCYCHERNEPKAIALFEKLKELNFASSSLAYANIMSLYLKLNKYKKVLAIYEQMQAENIDPDATTCGLLINCYGHLNDINSAERVIEEMEERNISMDWSVYCKLASVYNSFGFFEKAELVLKKAEHVINCGNRTAYHELITLYAGAGNLKETVRIWNILRSNFPRVYNMSYYIFLSALNTLGEMDHMKQTFEEWESICVQFDVKLLNLMIESYLSNGMVKEAELFREKGINKGFGSDPKTLSLFTDYYLSRHQMEKALKCLETINFTDKRYEWKPAKEKMELFLNYFEGRKDVDGAEKFYGVVKKLGCLDMNVCESLIRTHLAANRNDPSLFRRIKDDGFDVGSETEKLLIMCGSRF